MSAQGTERHTKCPRCLKDGRAVGLVHGQALREIWVPGVPDFIGQDPADLRGQTMVLSGTSRLTAVLKCPACGYSRTPDGESS